MNTQAKTVYIQNHYPLKQGLRLLETKAQKKAFLIQNHYPLKQGLRLEAKERIEAIENSKPLSIKTRIATT